MIVAPAKTPQPVVDKLHTEFKSLLATPEISGRISQTGMLPMATPSIDGLRGFIKSEIARWGNVVRKAGIAGSR
jgi:tripartite-type tricarboxylate transporter receptor subunit TctC